eukprot:COSAG05_NODE_2599_length_2857_cov_1.404278_2_plen_87_part_00
MIECCLQVTEVALHLESLVSVVGTRLYLNPLMQSLTVPACLRLCAGAWQAVLTLATLFPASFSLMFGSIKGTTLCKVLLPWSRLPG